MVSFPRRAVEVNDTKGQQEVCPVSVWGSGSLWLNLRNTLTFWILMYVQKPNKKEIFSFTTTPITSIIISYDDKC